MIRVFIEGKEIDLKEDITMDLNYAIADIMELDKRNTQFSKTIIIPNTNFNSEVFGYIYDIDVQNPFNESLPNVGINFNPTKKAQATIYKDNIAVFKGICRLISVTINKGEINYEINLFGRLKDILYELGETYIYELDWTDQDYIYNSTTWNTIYSDKRYAGDGLLPYEFCMPMVDYGDVVDLDVWDWKQFKPAVFIREILIRIFNHAGFVSDPALFAPFFNTNYFRHLVLINGERGVGQYLKDVAQYEVVNAGYDDYCTQVYLNDFELHGWLPFNSTPIYNNGGLWNYVNTTFTSALGFVYQRYYLQYTGVSALSFNVTTNFQIAVKWKDLGWQEGGWCQVFLRVKDSADNFVTNLWTEFFVFPDGLPVGGEYVKVFNVNFNGQYTFNPNDKIEIQLYGSAYENDQYLGMVQLGCFAMDYSNNGFIGNITFNFPSVQFTPLSAGSTAKISEQLPRGIKCVDLFKTIILMHNLYVEQDDNQDNLLHITPYPLYYDYDITKSADWTYKLDHNQEIRIIPLSELKAKRYKFTYTNDNDYWSESYAKRFNKEYGEKIESIDNDFLDTEEEIKLITSPCINVKPDDTDRVYLSLYKLDGTTKKPDKFKPRIAYFNNLIESDYPYAIYDGATFIYYSPVAYGYRYGYAGHFDDPINPTLDCNFTLPEEVYFSPSLVTGANLYETFWKKLISEISDKDSRLLIGYFKLDSYDVENIDFARLIKIHNQYYKLIKIENFNPNSDTLAKVHLFKVLYDTNFGTLNYLLQENTSYLLQENGINKFYI
jgi:hypothetical protein